MSRTIRTATAADLPAVLGIYEKARAYMARTGNPNQWGSTNPPRSLLEADIARGTLYVHEEAGAVFGVFALIPGEDPTYGRIDGGAWRSDAPYRTIASPPTEAAAGCLRTPLPSAAGSKGTFGSTPMRTTASCRPWCGSTAFNTAA